MTTTEVLIGLACGVGAGVLVGVVYWVVYVQWKKRSIQKQGNKSVKTSSDETRLPLIKQDDIPPFQIPRSVPWRIQEPAASSLLDTNSKPEHLSPPARKDSSGSRRPSVQLEDLIPHSTPIGRRSLSPTSPINISWTNKEAIESLEKPTKRKIGKFFDQTKSVSSPLGKLEFSLYYDQNFQDLQVHIVRGIQVYQPGSIDGVSELVVTVTIMFNGKRLWNDKTKPAEASPDPYFNDQLTVHGLTVDQMRLGTLKLTLLNNNTNSPISEMFYPLSSVPFNFFTTETLKLNDVESDEGSDVALGRKDEDCSSNGELLISMLHSPSDKKLTVGVECARGLPVGSRGYTDSYVKVEIVFIGHKLHSRKTKVFYKNTQPEYNELFEFDIANDKLPQITVNFKVKQYGKIRDTKIGMIRLGYTADRETEYRHWEEVLKHPYLNIENWHSIRKYR